MGPSITRQLLPQLGVPGNIVTVVLLLASSSPQWDLGLHPGESLEHIDLGRRPEGRLGLLGPNLPGLYGKESLSQRLGQARRGSKRKVLCPPAVFAGGWMFARRDAWGVGWGWAVTGSLVQLQLEKIPRSGVGQWLGALCRAAARPVCLHGKSSHHRLPSVPAFRSGTEQKAGLVRAERKGWQIWQSLVLADWPGAGHLGLVYTGSNEFSLESGSGVPEPELLPGVATLSGGTCPQGML